jgi:hypothetical protein
MAVIELLWRSCCTPSTETTGKLSARLKVRQWTQLLIDQSLLLGSSATGIHIHDIVLSYWRKRRTGSELPALHKQVVEELVASSKERMSLTGRGFQDTGSTAKAFDGEEVDWYVCNVASFHVKQSMDASMPLMENEDLKQWLLLDDETLVRAAAVVAGTARLELLVAHYRSGEEWFQAAKVLWAMGMVGTGVVDALRHGKEALELLQQVASATPQVQQFELDMRSNLGFNMRSADKKPNAGRMGELMKQNSSLRMDPIALHMTSQFPRCLALNGGHYAFWDAGKVATQETAQACLDFFMCEALPLLIKAAEEAVGARKEYIWFAFVLANCGIYMPMRSADETVKVQQRCFEAKWGRDGSAFTTAYMGYRFERHFMIPQGQ